MEKTEIDPFIKNVVASLFDTAQGSIKKREEVAPMIMLVGLEEKEYALIPLVEVESFFQSKEGRRKIGPLIKVVWTKFAHEHPAVSLVAVLVVSDAWVKTIPIEEYEKLPPEVRKTLRANEKSPEALMVRLEMSGRQITYQWPL